MIKTQEPTAAELAFNEFRKEFPLINVWVHKDQMIYRMNYDEKEVLERWKNRAEDIIKQLNLPIEVTTVRGQVATLPMLLTLIYKNENEKQSSDTDN